jgi:serine protease Do
VQTLFSAGAVSDEIAEMMERVRPSVVQVRTRGRGAGAGVIWRSDGGIITNFHVVAGGPEPIQVQLADGRSYDAKLINYNPALDLALLQVDAQDLPAALVADSGQLRIGELVFALGHPWGQPWVLTAGIVSGLGTVPIPRSGREAQYIRSDVGVAPGNSGGPMLNAEGAMVGITAMIFGGDMSVAIPSHVASEWVAGIPSRRLYLGVGLQQVALTPRPEKESDLALIITAVEPETPAERAGLLIGDVLVAVGDHKLHAPHSLLEAMARNADHGPMRLRLLRGGTTREIEVELVDAPEQTT